MANKIQQAISYKEKHKTIMNPPYIPMFSEKLIDSINNFISNIFEKLNIHIVSSRHLSSILYKKDNKDIRNSEILVFQSNLLWTLIFYYCHKTFIDIIPNLDVFSMTNYNNRISYLQDTLYKSDLEFFINLYKGHPRIDLIKALGTGSSIEFGNIRNEVLKFTKYKYSSYDSLLKYFKNIMIGKRNDKILVLCGDQYNIRLTIQLIIMFRAYLGNNAVNCIYDLSNSLLQIIPLFDKYMEYSYKDNVKSTDDAFYSNIDAANNRFSRRKMIFEDVHCTKSNWTNIILMITNDQLEKFHTITNKLNIKNKIQMISTENILDFSQFNICNILRFIYYFDCDIDRRTDDNNDMKIGYKIKYLFPIHNYYLTNFRKTEWSKHNVIHSMYDYLGPFKTMKFYVKKTTKVAIGTTFQIKKETEYNNDNDLNQKITKQDIKMLFGFFYTYKEQRKNILGSDIVYTLLEDIKRKKEMDRKLNYPDYMKRFNYYMNQK